MHTSPEPSATGPFAPESFEHDPYLLTLTECGREWRLARGDMERLWETMTDFDGEDERLPYWAELWPSSLVLARFLRAEAACIAGRRCLDIGCGIGFTALVGQWLGAVVLGMDYEPAALSFARRNARLNQVPSPLWAVMDWRRPAIAPGSIDVAWGGDIMYERRFAEPLAYFLRHVLRPGGCAFVAEPTRTVYEAFFAAVNAQGLGMRCVHREEATALNAQERPVPVRVWQITR